MTPDQAKLLVEAFEIEQFLDSLGYVSIIRRQNPELLDAYQALLDLSKPDEPIDWSAYDYFEGGKNP